VSAKHQTIEEYYGEGGEEPRSIVFEEFKRRLEEARSTGEVLEAVAWARSRGLRVEVTPAFYSEATGRFVVGAVEPYSGKVFHAAYVFRGAGSENIVERRTATVDLSREIAELAAEGFRSIRVDLAASRCRPELQVTLRGEKVERVVEQPPPQPSAYEVARKLLTTAVPVGRPLTGEQVAAREFQTWFWRHAPLLAKRYGIEGPIGTPQAEEILRRMAEAGELRLEGDALRVELKEPKYEPPPLTESVAAAFWRGFSSFAGPIAQLVSRIAGTSSLGRTVSEEIAAQTGVVYGRDIARVLASGGDPRERLEKWSELARRHGSQIALETAAGVAGAGLGLTESAMEWKFVITPALVKGAAKGAQIHELALREYAKASEAGKLSEMIKWRTVEAFTTPMRGLDWALRKAGIVTAEKRVYAPEELRVKTVEYGGVSGVAWQLEEKSMVDITRKWVEGSPAPRVTSLETPFFRVEAGLKGKGFAWKVLEAPFSLHPSMVKAGGKESEIVAVLSRKGGAFLVKGQPTPLPYGGEQTLKVIFPWERVAAKGVGVASGAAGGAKDVGGELLSGLKTVSKLGGGVPGVALKTLETVKTVPLSLPALSTVQKQEVKALPLEVKVESKTAAPAKVELKTETLTRSVALPSLSLVEAKREQSTVLPIPAPVSVQKAREAPAALARVEALEKAVQAAQTASVSLARTARAFEHPPIPFPPSPKCCQPPPPPLPKLLPPAAPSVARFHLKSLKVWRVEWFAARVRLPKVRL